MQKKEEDYNEDETAVSIVHKIAIRVVFTLILILRMIRNIYDIKGVFLHREFIDERKMCIEVPQG